MSNSFVLLVWGNTENEETALWGKLQATPLNDFRLPSPPQSCHQSSVKAHLTARIGMACLRMKWNTHLVVDGHAKVDESKHRHIHEDTLGKYDETENV